MGVMRQNAYLVRKLNTITLYSYGLSLLHDGVLGLTHKDDPNLRFRWVST